MPACAVLEPDWQTGYQSQDPDKSTGVVIDRLIVDTDLNFPSDDFQSLLLLGSRTDVELVGCCATAGNTWMEEVWWNLQTGLRILGRQKVPILEGTTADAFLPQLKWAKAQSGAGLVPFIGAYEKADCPRITSGQWHDRLTPGRSAAEFIASAAVAPGGPLDVICLGPLTNLSQAIKHDPLLPANLRRLFVMGGHFGPGTEAGHRPDFNFWFDPVAADHVLNSGLRVVLVPLEVCRAAGANDRLLAALGDYPVGAAGLFVDDFLGMVEQHGPHMALCDQLVAILHRHPELVMASEHGFVSVECDRNKRVGTSEFRPDPTGKVTVVRTVNIPEAHARLIDGVRELAAHKPEWEADPRCSPAHFFRSPRYEYFAEERLRQARVDVIELLADDRGVVHATTRHMNTAGEFLELARACVIGGTLFGTPVPCGTFLEAKVHERAVFERTVGADVFATCRDKSGRIVGIAFGSSNGGVTPSPLLSVPFELPGGTHMAEANSWAELRFREAILDGLIHAVREWVVRVRVGSKKIEP